MSARPLLVVMPTLALGGAERHATWLAVHADRSRWRPRVLAFADGPLRAELDAGGVPVEVAPLPRRGRLLAAAAAVTGTLRRSRAAVVTGHHILVEAALRSALRRLPVAARPGVLAWKHTYGHVGHRGVRERVFERATGGLVTRYGAVCHTQVRYLTGELGLPGHRLTVVPNAVALPERSAPAPTGPPTVLVTAAMRADKDHDRLLRCWPTVLARHPDARLLLAGDGPLRTRLLARRAALGLTERVEFLGVRTDVAALLARAHLVALASYSVECFPYAVLEAMAAGRGVVATNVGGLPELVDDGRTGRLVTPGDTDALAEALCEGLADAGAAAARWGAAGRVRCRRLYALPSWTHRVNALLAAVADAGPTSTREEHP